MKRKNGRGILIETKRGNIQRKTEKGRITVEEKGR